MQINYNVLDEMLSGLLESDDISIKCKEELTVFLQNHDVNVFSDESLKELTGILFLSIKPAYEAVTDSYLPNIFIKKDF